MADQYTTTISTLSNATELGVGLIDLLIGNEVSPTYQGESINLDTLSTMVLSTLKNKIIANYRDQNRLKFK